VWRPAFSTVLGVSGNSLGSTLHLQSESPFINAMKSRPNQHTVLRRKETQSELGVTRILIHDKKCGFLNAVPSSASGRSPIRFNFLLELATQFVIHRVRGDIRGDRLPAVAAHDQGFEVGIASTVTELERRWIFG
jgi:hypothetical protein